MIPFGILQQQTLGGVFNPNDYPNLVADWDASILSSLLDASDVPITGDLDDVVRSVLDSADSPSAYRWYGPGTTKLYKPDIDGHPCVYFPVGSYLYSVDGSTVDKQIHTTSQMTLFTVSRHVSGANNYNYVYRSGATSNGWHGVMFDTRTQKRLSHSIADGGATLSLDMTARDTTVNIRVMSILADHHGGDVKSHRDGGDQATGSSHATQEYYKTGVESELGGEQTAQYVFRVLVYNGLLTQTQHDEIATALVARYV